GNAYTVAGIHTQLWGQPEINTITFIHRGGLSGSIYDISKDGGQSWNIDTGALYLNGSGTPQGVIYNAAGNTVADSAYLAFFAPTPSIRGDEKLKTGSASVWNSTPDSTDGTYPIGYTITKKGVLWSAE